MHLLCTFAICLPLVGTFWSKLKQLCHIFPETLLRKMSAETKGSKSSAVVVTKWIKTIEIVYSRK